MGRKKAKNFLKILRPIWAPRACNECGKAEKAGRPGSTCEDRTCGQTNLVKGEPKCL